MYLGMELKLPFGRPCETMDEKKGVDITLCDDPTFFRGRNPIRSLALLLPALLIWACSDEQPKEEPVTALQGTIFVDAYGDTIELGENRPHLLSLAPNLTEIIYALGGGKQLLARTDFCDYPPEVGQLESIGTLGTYSYETILALGPDLLLMMTFDGSSRSEYDRLKALGLRPVAFSEGDVPHVIDMIDEVGVVIGREKEAGAMTAEMRSRLDSIAAAVSNEAPVATFVVIQTSPLMTVSGDFITSMLTIAGGRNVVAGDPLAYPRYSREALLGADPEAIIYPSVDPDGASEFQRLYPEIEQTEAGASGRIMTIDPNLVARPGPRIIDGIIRIRELITGDTTPGATP